MNAERLHAISEILKGDFQNTKVVNLLQKLFTFYQESMKNPNSQVHEQIGKTYQSLDEALSNSIVSSCCGKDVLESCVKKL